MLVANTLLFYFFFFTVNDDDSYFLIGCVLIFITPTHLPTFSHYHTITIFDAMPNLFNGTSIRKYWCFNSQFKFVFFFLRFLNLKWALFLSLCYMFSCLEFELVSNDITWVNRFVATDNTKKNKKRQNGTALKKRLFYICSFVHWRKKMKKNSSFRVRCVFLCRH